MILGDTLHLALRNLRQARLRTGLTTLGVAIGVGALAAMVSLGVGLQEQIIGRFLKSGVFDQITVFPRNPGFGRNAQRAAQRQGTAGPGAPSTPAKVEKPPATLDDAALQQIAALKLVKEAYPNLRIPMEVRFGTFSEFTAAASVPLSVRGEGIYQKVAYGNFFTNDSEDSCMLSLDFAKRIPGTEPGELIGKEVILGYASASGAGSPVPLMGGLSIQRVERPSRIVGIIEREPGPGMGFSMFASVLIPLRKAQEMGAADIANPQSLLRQLSDKRSYQALTVKVKRPQDVEEVEKSITDMGFQAFSLNDALKGAKKAFILLDLLLSLTGSVALAVASLGIVNTMVMSILERTREIGIMKAIGGSDGDIRKIFLVEASAIGLAGGIFGVLLGWAVGKAINFGANLYIESQGGTPEKLFSLPWWLVLGGIAFSIAVSLIAGCYPASRAARLDPIQALRHD